MVDGRTSATTRPASRWRRARSRPRPASPAAPLLSFIACGAIVRRAAVLEAGGFDARLGIGGEEELLAWDLAARGWLMSYVPGGRSRTTTRRRRPAAGPSGASRGDPQHAVDDVAAPAPRAPRRGGRRASSCGCRATATRSGRWRRPSAGCPWLHRERRVLPAEVERRVRMLEDAQLARRDYA